MKYMIQFLPRRGRFRSLMIELEKLGVQCSILPYVYNEKFLSTPSIDLIGYISKYANADIFITANPYYGLFGASLAKKFGNIKHTVFRLVGDYWTENYFRNGNFNYKIRCLLKSLENSLALKDVDLNLAISDWLHKKASNKGIKNIYTLYNGVDYIRFRPRKTYGKYRTQILCVMNFNIHQKIVPLYDFLIEYKYNNLPYHITFLGDGIHLNSIKNHVLNLGLNKHVAFKGWIKNIEYYYSNCDIVIHPSGLDAFPTTLLEAGASAKPVVATNVGGIPEIIVDGKTGFITSNLSQFLFYIEKLMENYDLRVKMGTNARFRMLDKFTWKKIAKNFYNILIIENILGKTTKDSLRR